MVEQHLDMVEVVGSSPIPRTQNNIFAPRFNPRGAFSFKGGLGRGVHAVTKSACTFSVYVLGAENGVPWVQNFRDSLRGLFG